MFTKRNILNYLKDLKIHLCFPTTYLSEAEFSSYTEITSCTTMSTEADRSTELCFICKHLQTYKKCYF